MVKLYTIFDKELNQRMFYLMDNYRRVVVTSIDLDADKESASYGESVTFTAVVTDKDNNPVSGSTVSFYNINSRLGAAISDGNGVATFSYVVRHDLSVNARADEVQSNTVAVTMDEDVYELVLSCDAPIIESGGSTSVNCLLTHNGDAVSGESLNYIINHGSTSIDSGSVTTGNDGTASISYTGTGVGDVDIVVEYGTLLQKTFVVQDCHYFNDGSRVSDLEIGSNVSCTTNGDYITITTSTSGEKDVKLPVTLNSDWEFTTELAENMATGSQLTFKIDTGQQWGAFNPNNTITVNLGSSQNFNRTVSKGMVLKITYINGTMTVYWNDEQLTSRAVTVSGKIGYYTNNGRYQYIKNIKLKAL